jgi:hypothetical protein
VLEARRGEVMRRATGVNLTKLAELKSTATKLPKGLET